MAAFSSSSPSMFRTSTIDKMCGLLEPSNTNACCFPLSYHSDKTLEDNTINNNEQEPDSSIINTVANKNITTMDHYHSSSNFNDYDKFCDSSIGDRLVPLNSKKRKSKPNSCAESSKMGTVKGKNKAVQMKEEVELKKKGKEEKKTMELGYIHVRAKRGQATDSHSLAERVRRERISERMRLLQALVPGCDKVTGKALMLDEIINYVQSLQNQVEFLSMKLASVNPMYSAHNLGMDLMNSFPADNQNNLNGVASPLDHSSPTTATNTYPQFLDNSVDPLLLQHPQIFPNDLSQMLWEVDDHYQRQEMINRTDIISDTLFSFH